MALDYTLVEYGQTVGRFTVVFALGLMLMEYSAMTYWQTAYMAVNPAIGDVSTSTAGAFFHIGLFLLGAILVFTSTMSALYKVLGDADI